MNLLNWLLYKDASDDEVDTSKRKLFAQGAAVAVAAPMVAKGLTKTVPAADAVHYQSESFDDSELQYLSASCAWPTDIGVTLSVSPLITDVYPEYDLRHDD